MNTMKISIEIESDTMSAKALSKFLYEFADQEKELMHLKEASGLITSTKLAKRWLAIAMAELLGSQISSQISSHEDNQYK